MHMNRIYIIFIFKNLEKYVIIPSKIVFIRHALQLCKKSTIYNYIKFYRTLKRHYMD